MRNYWKGLDLFEKILIGVIFFLVIHSAYLHLKNKSLENQIFKVVQESKEEKEDSLKVAKENIKTIVKKKRVRTKSVQKKAKEIDKKLKQDENEINNSNVTDDDIINFITKHQKR